MTGVRQILNVYQPERTLLWRIPECPYAVTIAASVLREIDFAVVEAFHAVPHGGVEVGGVFFGLRLEDSLQIQTHCPIKCEYLFGPSFSLSTDDKSALSDVLKLPESDPQFAGLAPIGWYCSHTRSGIFLSAEDLELYREFFPACWQIAMVLRPERLQPTRAGFFFHDQDGNINSNERVHEFVLIPPAYGLIALDSEAEHPEAENDAAQKLEDRTVFADVLEPNPSGDGTNVAAPLPSSVASPPNGLANNLAGQRFEPAVRTTDLRAGATQSPMSEVRESFREKTTWWQRCMRWLQLTWDSNRRSARRTPGNGLLAFYWNGGTPKGHRVRDISVHGAFLESDDSWPCGTHVTITFRATATDKSDSGSPDALVVRAMVVWTSHEGSGFKFALRDSAEQHKLRRFLNRWNSVSAQLLSF